MIKILSSLEIYEIHDMREALALEEVLAEMESNVGGITTLIQATCRVALPTFIPKIASRQPQGLH